MHRDQLGIMDQSDSCKRRKPALQTLSTAQAPDIRLAVTDDVNVCYFWHL